MTNEAKHDDGSEPTAGAANTKTEAPRTLGCDERLRRIEADLVKRFGSQMLKTSEVAAFLRLSSATVLKIPRDRLPRGEGRGPRPRYLAADVAAYMVNWIGG